MCTIIKLWEIYETKRHLNPHIQLSIWRSNNKIRTTQTCLLEPPDNTSLLNEIQTHFPHLSPFPHSQVSCKSLHNLSLSIFTSESFSSVISVVLISFGRVTEKYLYDGVVYLRIGEAEGRDRLRVWRRVERMVEILWMLWRSVGYKSEERLSYIRMGWAWDGEDCRTKVGLSKLVGRLR